MIPRSVLAACAAVGLAVTAQAQAEDAADPRAAVVEAAKADPENWRQVEPDRLIVFETTKGRILIEMFPEVAPKHAEQFTAIVKSGLYEGTAFHRVIEGFMAQGGDIYAVNGEGSGLDNVPGEFTFRRSPSDMPLALIGPESTATEGYFNGFPIRTQSKFLAEMTKDGMVDSWIPHCKGVVSTARTDDPNSANSQFFLMRETSPHLDKTYTAWGRVVDGQAVVDTLKKGEPVVNPDVLQSAHMVSDLPEGERPTVWVQRTEGPRFTALLAGAGEVPICELPAVSAVVDG